VIWSQSTLTIVEGRRANERYTSSEQLKARRSYYYYYYYNYFFSASGTSFPGAFGNYEWKKHELGVPRLVTSHFHPKIAERIGETGKAIIIIIIITIIIIIYWIVYGAPKKHR